MAQRKNFNSKSVPQPNPVFPQAVITGDLIFVSGTPGYSPATGKIISNDFEEQAMQAFANIKAILEEAGSSMDKVIKTTIFMVTGNDFNIINKVYAAAFRDIDAPARSTPQVMPFPGGILISVECIALV